MFKFIFKRLTLGKILELNMTCLHISSTQILVKNIYDNK